MRATSPASSSPGILVRLAQALPAAVAFRSGQDPHRDFFGISGGGPSAVTEWVTLRGHRDANAMYVYRSDHDAAIAPEVTVQALLSAKGHWTRTSISWSDNCMVLPYGVDSPRYAIGKDLRMGLVAPGADGFVKLIQTGRGFLRAKRKVSIQGVSRTSDLDYTIVPRGWGRSSLLDNHGHECARMSRRRVAVRPDAAASTVLIAVGSNASELTTRTENPLWHFFGYFFSV